MTDPSGAALPNAQVTLKNLNTGATQSATTSAQGTYRFALVPPGSYSVTVTATGFTTAERRVIAAAGSASTADIQLTVAASSTTVDVTENATVVQAENADNTTTYSTQQILNLPNPGGDITYYAQTAPGVVMNTQAGYGNLTVSGLPSTSNLFTINGQNTNDPYFNTNNSGASNLMLGSNEIAEAAVVTNGYSGQWGQLSGAQVNYITLSGSNEFHGNANYFWNGRYLNANDFFANSVGQDRPFSNANQWSTRLGGPIWKNKTFFFVNYEGLRLVAPSASTLVRIPSTQFQGATITNLNATGRGALVPFYNQIFSVYNNSPYRNLAQPVANSCGTGSFGLTAGTPCVYSYRVSAPGRQKEYQWAARVDHQLTDADRIYLRLFRDNGEQATYTDPINPVFNSYSPQPQMSGQVHHTHTFGGRAVNEINFSAFHYSASFALRDPAGAAAAFPTVIQYTGTVFTNTGGTAYNYPQGRRITQYQLIDDLSYIAGRHNLKFGVNYHRDDITELSYSVLANGRIIVGSLSEFFNGGGGSNTRLQQRFPTAAERPLALYVLGLYAQDEWRVSSNLRLTLSLRIDHNSNPVCQQDCFARFASEFNGSAVPVTTPYNATIIHNQHQAYPATDKIIWQPRVGMAWQPFGNDRTVLRGGVGIFGDEIPAILAQNLTRLTPDLNSFTINNALIAGPGIAGSPFTTAAQANQTLRQQFASGGTLASIRQAFPGFTVPNFTSTSNFVKQPRVYEWNLELQQSLGWNTLLSLNYVGTRGIGWLVPNAGLNGYGFANLPPAQPDPRFGIITSDISAGKSLYNGATLSLRKRFSHGLVFGANYTYSHAYDNVANGGLLQLDFATNESIAAPQNPYNINQYNWGNADSDVRHYFSGNFVLDDFVYNLARRGPKTILGGWTLAGNIFFRTGLPYTVIDSTATGLASAKRYGNTLFASPVGPIKLDNCGHGAVDTPCVDVNQFAPEGTLAYGNQARNQFRGPKFVDTDITITKGFKITERVGFQVGAQFYNVFNHPNFDKPSGDVADPNFGLITSTVSVPTSILGSFVGAAASPRLIQLKGRVTF